MICCWRLLLGRGGKDWPRTGDTLLQEWECRGCVTASVGRRDALSDAAYDGCGGSSTTARCGSSSLSRIRVRRPAGRPGWPAGEGWNVLTAGRPAAKAV